MFRLKNINRCNYWLLFIIISVCLCVDSCVNISLRKEDHGINEWHICVCVWESERTEGFLFMEVKSSPLDTNPPFVVNEVQGDEELWVGATFHQRLVIAWLLCVCVPESSEAEVEVNHWSEDLVEACYWMKQQQHHGLMWSGLFQVLFVLTDVSNDRLGWGGESVCGRHCRLDLPGLTDLPESEQLHQTRGSLVIHYSSDSVTPVNRTKYGLYHVRTQS